MVSSCTTKRSHHTTDLMKEVYWEREESKAILEWRHGMKERHTYRQAGRQREQETKGH